MQRTFRAPRCSNPCPVIRDPSPDADDRLRIKDQLYRYGFTLIEVVIALALCGLVAAVTAASLHAALGAERQAVQVREARRTADRVHQALLNPAQSENLLSGLLAEWTLTKSAQSTGPDTNSVRWTVWTLNHREQAHRQATVIVRE
jgi:prepilin-type N-terminal cleavage/methylation domain-containing protein